MEIKNNQDILGIKEKEAVAKTIEEKSLDIVKKNTKKTSNKRNSKKARYKGSTSKKVSTNTKKSIVNKNATNIDEVAKEELKNSEVHGRKLNKHDLTDFNMYLFHEGKNFEAYNILGAHFTTESRVKGVRFTTWAPNATSVYVVGDFNLSLIHI